MNIVIEASHKGRRVQVSLSASDVETTEVATDFEDAGHEATIIQAMDYLSGLDGKTVTPDTATIADWAIVIGKHAEGNIRFLSGKLPADWLTDPMGDTDSEDAP